jgi:metallophosphoesterase superfamily enzyme
MIRSSPKPKQSSSTKPWATPSRSRIKLAGIELVPDLSGALYIPDFATLVFSDLHLEKASSLAARGMALPPYDTRATIALLAHAVANHRPQRIVFLGDSFHDADGPTRLLGEDLDNLRRAIGGAEAIWIAGNHDPSFTFDLGGTAET